MASVISREQSREGFDESLAKYIPLTAQLEEADVKWREAYAPIDKLQREFEKQRFWKRLWGWALEKSGKKLIVPQELKDLYEQTKADHKAVEEKRDEVYRALLEYGKNLPGLHWFTGNMGFQYHPSDPNGMPWHIRMFIDITAGEEDTQIFANTAFPALRYQTARTIKGDHIFIPKNDKLPPILQLTTGRYMPVGIHDDEGRGSYIFAPQATRRALLLNPDSLIRREDFYSLK